MTADGRPFYELRRGEKPNPVVDAALAYLKAARLVWKHEIANSAYFLSLLDWFVVHHLSFISVELYLKSLKVTVYHSLSIDEAGPEWQEYNHSYNGHSVNLGQIAQDTDDMRGAISEEQWKMIKHISADKNAKEALSIGRYPYESKHNGFPAGDVGRNLASEWLQLAESLAAFIC